MAFQSLEIKDEWCDRRAWLQLAGKSRWSGIDSTRAKEWIEATG